MNSIIVVFDNKAPSFCNYSSNASMKDTLKIIDFDLFSNLIDSIVDENLGIILVHSNIINQEYENVLDKCNFTRIIPPNLLSFYSKDNNIVVTLSVEECFSVDEKLLVEDLERVLIIRVNKNNLSNLNRAILNLYRVAKRINIVFESSELLATDQLLMYKKELCIIKDTIIKNSTLNSKVTEINAFTDSLLNKSHNFCNAGKDHITMNYTGKFYICPAFIYDDKFKSLENVNIASDFSLGYNSLNQIELCLNCPNNQCQNCFYFNKLTTEEFNIPSYEQCDRSNIEKEIADSFIQ